MTRQTRKTQQAIFSAFIDLTMQEIADRADVGRSTIYSHFETKEELLKALCNAMFHELLPEDMGNLLAHESIVRGVFEHILENKKIIIGLFSSEGAEVFVDYCKAYFGKLLTTSLLMEYNETKIRVPKDLLVNHIVCSFVDMVKWWVKNHMEESPEKMEEYFITLTHPILRTVL